MVEAVSSEALLSQRGRENLAEMSESFKALIELLANTYDPEHNPNGVVSLGIAENTLMQKDLIQYMNSKINLDGKSLTYGDGPTGSLRLRTNLARFFNDYFNPVTKVSAEEISVGAGVSGVLDQVAWATCNEGEGMLIGRPVYPGFVTDLEARSKAVAVPVAFGDIDPFSIEALACYEEQLRKSNASGTKIRGLIFTNPHNPFGKCYDLEAIKAYMRFCQTHRLHFISDEIYAMSVFERTQKPGEPAPVPFYSALSIDLQGIIDSSLVHVLYGMSKDFSSNGLRLGALITRNTTLRDAITSIAVAAWPSAPADHLWATMLEDRTWLNWYFQENRKKLKEGYELLTRILDTYDIQYLKGGNAGVFLWCDLRFALEGWDGGKGRDKVGLEEDQILSRKILDSGVFIANSQGFQSEQVGWYRITFSHPKEVLFMGLKRLLKVLKGVDIEMDQFSVNGDSREAVSAGGGPVAEPPDVDTIERRLKKL